MYKTNFSHQSLDEMSMAAQRSLANDLGHAVSEFIKDPVTGLYKAKLYPGQAKTVSPELYQRYIQEKRLFPNGVKNLEFNQSNIGDCYLLSAIYSIGNHPQGATILKNMIKVLPDGSFQVTFKGMPHRTQIVKLEELKGQGAARSVNGSLGVRIIERAYGKLRKQEFNDPTKQKSLAAIVGGYGHDPLFEITGYEPRWLNAHGQVLKGDISNLDYNVPSFKTVMDQQGISKEQTAVYKILKQLEANPQSFMVTVGTPPKHLAHNLTGKRYIFYANHEYALESVHFQNNTVTVVNPHETKTKMVITIDEFLSVFNSLSGVKVH
jgi:hypothetical protein